MLVAPPLAVLVVAALGCGGSRGAGGPTTAKQKLAQEQADQPPSDAKAGVKKWGKWRYHGDRGACFYELDGTCFKTEKAACTAAKCKASATCVTAGAAPAQVSCKAGAARR